ncbi:unnamed protein product, partial [Amoebophrya sp. A25]|eukprot:GSA25T00025161001.1
MWTAEHYDAPSVGTSSSRSRWIRCETPKSQHGPTRTKHATSFITAAELRESLEKFDAKLSTLESLGSTCSSVPKLVTDKAFIDRIKDTLAGVRALDGDAEKFSVAVKSAHSVEAEELPSMESSEFLHHHLTRKMKLAAADALLDCRGGA